MTDDSNLTEYVVITADDWKAMQEVHQEARETLTQALHVLASFKCVNAFSPTDDDCGKCWPCAARLGVLEPQVIH